MFFQIYKGYILENRMEDKAMDIRYSFTYLDCQRCAARIHCDECEARLAGMLTRISHIHSAQLQMADKKIFLNTELNPEELEEMLEDLGIFVQG